MERLSRRIVLLYNNVGSWEELPMNTLTKMLAAAAAFGAMTVSAMAQDVTLRFHQMLAPQATIPSKAIVPWMEKVMAESDGRLKIEKYDTMSLGGTPPQLVDQVIDGVVDFVWTVVGYTPGRFPSTEAFELPFMMTNGEATSKAFHEYCEKYCADEFKDMKVIAWHTHGPGLIHSRNAVNKLEDMNGLKIRGGTRVVNQMLEKLGATPIGMPVAHRALRLRVARHLCQREQQLIHALRRGVFDHLVFHAPFRLLPCTEHLLQVRRYDVVPVSVLKVLLPALLRDGDRQH
jgi:hypothetical protein